MIPFSGIRSAALLPILLTVVLLAAADDPVKRAPSILTARPELEGRIKAEDYALKGQDEIDFSKFRNGELPLGKGTKELLQKAARYHIFRLTYTETHEALAKDRADPTMTVLSMWFNRGLPRLIPDPANQPNETKRSNQQKYVKEFSDALIPPIERVLKNKEALTRISAARVLARIGEVGQEGAADTMIKVIEDPEQIDAVKLWAIKGLGELYAYPDFKFKQAERKARVIHALLNFVTRKPKSEVKTPEEIDGFRYLRREAIRALGRCKKPLAGVENGVAVRPVALTLLRVVRKDGMSPPPSLSEQCEAALGVCQMSFDPGYNRDYAAQQLGLFIVELCGQHSADVKKTAGKAMDWEHWAERLIAAFKKLDSTAPRNAHVTAICSSAQPLLASIQHRVAANPESLRTLLSQAPPEMKKTLYAADPNSTIKAGQSVRPPAKKVGP